MRRVIVLFSLAAFIFGVGVFGVWASRTDDAKLASLVTDDGFVYGPKFTEVARAYGCDRVSDPFHCLEGYFYERLRIDGVKAVLTQVEEISMSVAPEPFGCHALVHALGRRHIQRSLADGLLSVRDATLVCKSGFIHGAFEAAGHYLDSHELQTTALALCTSLEGERGDECIHASGHAFSIQHPRNVEDALMRCELFGESGITCADGVLMAYSLGSPPIGDTYDPSMDPSWYWMGFDKESAPGACMRVRADWRSRCWLYLWNAFYLIDGLGVDAYYEQCPVEAGDDRTRCFRNGGRLVSMLADTSRTLGLMEACKTRGPARTDCIYGVAWFYGEQAAYLSISDDEPASVCQLLLGDSWSDRDRTSCVAGVRRAYENR